jgi:sugar (pentulose or hexulose) kinase
MNNRNESIRNIIAEGKASLGIEFGSTRIKAVLIGEDHSPIATGICDWENKLENGIWTYHLEDIWNGLADCYADLASQIKNSYDIELTTLSALGFSGMMHGYMAFDKNEDLLVPFRTWRNTTTGQAASELTSIFHFNIPQRWSIAHLYQAILNQEPHVSSIASLTTLAGYIHWKLTGCEVLGIGEASGMFPVDSTTKQFDSQMLDCFDALIAPRHLGWKIRDILPEILTAGEKAGILSEEGAKLLDRSGQLKAGCPVCPPEGDAGTGMTATNSVSVRTGNVSAGTSIFSMVVLEKGLNHMYPEIDMVTTPAGDPVAMVHCNNCTSDLNAWVNIFREFAEISGIHMDTTNLFSTLYEKALTGDTDCGGLLAYNYISGEPVTGFETGRPLFVRTPDSHFTLANFMRTHLYASLSTLKKGMDILIKNENVQLDQIHGHGGLFKTKFVGQKVVAAALNVPVSVMDTAGEGGAWGIAVLASYMLRKKEGETLAAYLNSHVFSNSEESVMQPDPKEVEGFLSFMNRYMEGLAIEKAATDHLH